VTPTTAGALAAALWAGCLLPGPWWLVLVALSLLTVACAGPRGLTMLLVGAALLAAGSGLAGGRVHLQQQGPLADLAASGRAADLYAVVVTEPRPTTRGAWFLVRVVAMDGAPMRGRAGLRVDRVEAAPALGERLRLRATARPVEHDGFGGHLRRLHAATWLHPLSPPEVTAPAGRLLRATNTVRANVRAAAQTRLDPDRAALLVGLVTGDARDRRPERAEQFAAASLSHLVVVSGKHVALMLASVLTLAGALGVGARGRRWLGLVAVGWYAVLTRWQPSVLRASAMASLVLAGGLLGRGHEPRHALAMAIVVLLLVDPMLAGQLGFVLSVSATAGVLVVAPWVAERLRGPRPVRLLVAVTLGAQLGAAPALLSLQGGLPLWSVPANLVAVPAASVAQAIGLAAAVVAQASVAAGGIVARAAGPPLSAILWAAETFSAGPMVGPEHLLTPAAIILLGAVLIRRRAPRLAAVATAIVLVAWLVPRPAAPVGSLTVTLLDVGQGDALLVEVPGAGGAPPARMLMDGGQDPQLALRLLRTAGVRRLDVVALSHPHHDHSGGLPAILDRLSVGALLVGPTPLDSDDSDSAVADSAVNTYATAMRRGVPIVPVAPGQWFALGTAVVEVLSPPPDRTLAHNLNEDSLVVRVVHPDGRVLLTGDAEDMAQALLLRRPERIRADVLKVPHHGGNTNAPGFLEAVGAQVALIGVGRDNDYGHPHPAVLDALDGMTVYRTDVHGTVRLSLPVAARRGGRPRPAAPCPSRSPCPAGRPSRRRPGPHALPPRGRPGPHRRAPPTGPPGSLCRRSP
jgi:competence protein ComEC